MDKIQQLLKEITEADGDLELNMTCRENEAELGVQNGQTIRNRNRHRVQQGFAIQLEANGSIKAKLGLEMSAGEAAGSEWAYYDETTEEWVPMESSYQDGMLVCNTDHFSTWTVISSGFNYMPIVYTGIVLVAILGAVVLMKKKRN